MSILAFRRPIAIAALALGCTACAAGGASMGKVAGDVVGGTAWVAMKGGSAAWKGGAFAVKTTGRAMVGAAKGVHQEFSKPQAVKTAKASESQVAALSQ